MSPSCGVYQSARVLRAPVPARSFARCHAWTLGSSQRSSSELSAMLTRPLLTLERVDVCKRDGMLLSEPSEPPPVEQGGLAYWQKLTVYAGEQTRHDGEPLYSALVRRLWAEGAAGATALRG